MTQAALLDTVDKMKKAVAHTQADFSTVRTGRATPALVEKLVVEYYGSEMPLQQLAGFSVPEARVLIIQPFDRGAVGAIEKATRNSDLGINPSNDGVIIRLNFPPLTEERRKDLVKVVKQKAEEGKVAIRNLRRQARQDLESQEKASDISSDDLERAQKELDKLTHDHVEDIDKALAAKEKELLAV